MAVNVMLVSSSSVKCNRLYDELINDELLSVKQLIGPLPETCERLSLYFPDIVVLLCAGESGDTVKRAVNTILSLPEVRIILEHDSIQALNHKEARRIILCEESSANGVDAMAGGIRSLCNRLAQEKVRTSSEAYASRLVSLPREVVEDYVIAIGASTGGTEALATLFSYLPLRMPGIMVVQHMPPGFTHMFAQRLNSETYFSVSEAKHNTVIAPGTIQIAPGSNQMSLKKLGGRFALSIDGQEKHSGHCPSVDYMFHSVARTAGKKAVGIILTGMGADGAAGLLTMRRHGAYTIGQDEKSSIVYGMPRKAMENGAVMRQAGLSDIPGILLTYLKKLGG